MSDVSITIYNNTSNIPLVSHTHICISHIAIHSQSFVKLHIYMYRSTVFALCPCNTGPFLLIYDMYSVFPLLRCRTGPFLQIYLYSTVFALRPCNTGPFLLIWYIYSTVFALRPCTTGPFLPIWYIYTYIYMQQYQHIQFPKTHILCTSFHIWNDTLN